MATLGTHEVNAVSSLTGAGSNQPGAWRALPILILLYAFALLDRQILILMVGPIKRDLQISDFHVGLLQGLAFAIFYSLASLPIGWLVDKYPRRPIIFLGVTAWGLAASACGLAQNFIQLFTARIAVGIGEAALSPAAYSMVADLFRPARLAFVMSLLMIGSCLGSGLAVGLGGAIVGYAESGATHHLPIIGQLTAWQFVFVVTGLPGLLLGALIYLIREPVRRDIASKHAPTLRDTLQFIRSQRRFFVCHFAGFGLLSVVGCGFLNWLPTYMIRAFGWSIGQVSVPLAILLGVVSTAGTLATGYVIDRLYSAGRTDAHLRVFAAIAIALSVLGVLAFQVSQPGLFLLIITPMMAVLIIAAGAGAALQIVTPNEMRGQIGAMFLLVMNGIGLGLGPTVVGAITDFLFHDEARLGSSIALLFGIGGPAAAILLMLGTKPMRDAVASAEAWRS